MPAAGGTTPELQVRPGGPPEGWDAALPADTGSLFHCEAWARYRCHGGGADPLFCEWRDPGTGGTLARALAIVRPPRSSLAGRALGHVTFDSAPVGGPDGLDYLTPLRDWARRERSVVRVSLGSFAARARWSPAGVPAAVERLEFLIEPGDESEIWSAMGSQPRRNVRRAERAGVAVRPAGEAADLRAFAALHEQTMQRLEQTKGVHAARMDHGHFAGELGELVQRGHGRLYLAEREGEPEAGCFFGTFGTGAFYVYGGARPAARDSGALPLALYTALRDLHGSGAREVNLGGTPADATSPDSPDHGLYNFKLRFGGRPVERTSGALVPRPGRERAVALARRLLRR